MRMGQLGLGLVGIAALALAGCGGLLAVPEPARQGDTTAPGLRTPGVLTGVFGPVTAQPPATVDPNVAGRQIAVRCPAVDIREGTETLRTFDGAGGDPNRLRWQAVISETVRECQTFPTEGLYRIGVVGRVVIGPVGGPGTYTVPIRVVATRGGDNVVFSRLLRVPATVRPGEGVGAFSVVVDDIRIPREGGDPLANVQLVVGFDPAPERPAPRRRARS